MQRRTFICGGLGVWSAALLPLSTATAQSDAPKRKPDLGDVAQGTYVGDVISDPTGASKNDVTLTVARKWRPLPRVFGRSRSRQCAGVCGW